MNRKHWFKCLVKSDGPEVGYVYYFGNLWHSHKLKTNYALASKLMGHGKFMEIVGLKVPE